MHFLHHYHFEIHLPVPFPPCPCFQQYAMQQAFKTMMGQMGTQNSQFSSMNFPPGSPFNYPPPYTSGPSPPSSFPYPPPFSTGPSTSIGPPYQPTSTAGPSTSTASAAFSVPSQATSAPTASEAAVAVDVSTINVEAAGPEVVKNEAENKSAAKKPGTVSLPPSAFKYCLCLAVDIIVHPSNF